MVGRKTVFLGKEKGIHHREYRNWKGIYKVMHFLKKDIKRLINKWRY
jgi:hypothetical protein